MQRETNPDELPVRPEQLLTAIAAVAPACWYPRQYAEALLLDRQRLDEPLWHLRQQGLIQVDDWQKGLGQGFRLSDAGAAVVLELQKPVPPRERPAAPELARLPEPRDSPADEADIFNPPAALVSPALVLANVVWFLVGMVFALQAGLTFGAYLRGEEPGMNAVLMRAGAVTPTSLLQGDYWRLATSCFVHIGILHLMSNMFVLGMVGPIAEGLWGRRAFALVYLVSGLGGSIMAMALMPTVEEGKQIRDVLLAGASGAIWGILVALVMWLWLNWDELSQDQAQFWIRRLLLVLALNLALSFGPGISWLGHLAGGFTGGLLLIALHWSLRRQIRGPLLILLLIVLLGGILPVGTKSFTSWKELKDRVQSQKERRIISTYLTVRTNAQLLMDRYRNGLFLLDSKSPLVVKTTQDLERFQQDLQQIRQIADKNQDHAELGELLPRAEEFAQAFAEVLKTQNQPNLDRLVKAWDALQALPMK